MANQYQTIFADAFDTFKVFDNLTVSEINNTPAGSPKTIWQVLNHLVKWQQYQLSVLENIKDNTTLNEDATWIDETTPAGQQELDNALANLKNQHRHLI